MPQIKRCKEPFATEVGGLTRVITTGDLVFTDDPVYTRGTAQHFEDIDVHVAAAAGRRAAAEGRTGVEQATAGPGELRSLTPARPAPGPAPAEAPFDPGAHTIREVLAHLDGADAAETARVLDAEGAGQARKGVLVRADPGAAAQSQ